jgi:hypothetical protein
MAFDVKRVSSKLGMEWLVSRHAGGPAGWYPEGLFRIWSGLVGYAAAWRLRWDQAVASS